MRFLKRFLYGIFYLSIFAGFGAGIYFVFLVPAPSCIDNTLNQKETAVDCGPDIGVGPDGPFSAGGCLPCELKTLKMSITEPKAYALSPDATSIALEVTNPSANYGLKKLEYTYDIYASGNLLLRSVTGESSLYPSEKKYLVVSGIDIDKRRIARVEIALGDINWVTKNQLPQKPSATITGEKVSESLGSVLIAGMVNNNSAVKLSSLRVVAVGYGIDGVISAISTYEIAELLPFSSAEYRIFLPAGKYSNFKTYLEIPPQ